MKGTQTYGLKTADGRSILAGDAVTFSGNLGAVLAYINAGCPPPTYPNGCPVLSEGPQRDDL